MRKSPPASRSRRVRVTTPAASNRRRARSGSRRRAASRIAGRARDDAAKKYTAISTAAKTKRAIGNAVLVGNGGRPEPPPVPGVLPVPPGRERAPIASTMAGQNRTRKRITPTPNAYPRSSQTETTRRSFPPFSFTITTARNAATKIEAIVICQTSWSCVPVGPKGATPGSPPMPRSGTCGRTSSPRCRVAIANARDESRRTAANRSRGGSQKALPRTATAIDRNEGGPLVKGIVRGGSKVLEGREHLRAAAVPADLEEQGDRDEPEGGRDEAEADEERDRNRALRQGGAAGPGCCEVARGAREEREHADPRHQHGEAEGEDDRHPLRVEDLPALPRELVVDPLPALVNPLHEARGLELLEVLEEGRLAQVHEGAEVRHGRPPCVQTLQDLHADLGREGLEALLVEGDRRALDRGRREHPGGRFPCGLLKASPGFGRGLTEPGAPTAGPSSSPRGTA